MLASLSKQRTAQMKAITATIQKEQNTVVRHEDVPVPVSYTHLDVYKRQFPCLARCVAPRTVESFAHHNFAAIRGRSKLLDEAVLRVGNQCVRNPQRTVIHKDSRLEKRLASA